MASQLYCDQCWWSLPPGAACTVKDGCPECGESYLQAATVPDEAVDNIKMFPRQPLISLLNWISSRSTRAKRVPEHWSTTDDLRDIELALRKVLNHGGMFDRYPSHPEDCSIRFRGTCTCGAGWGP